MFEIDLNVRVCVMLTTFIGIAENGKRVLRIENYDKKNIQIPTHVHFE